MVTFIQEVPVARQTLCTMRQLWINSTAEGRSSRLRKKLFANCNKESVSRPDCIQEEEQSYSLSQDWKHTFVIHKYWGRRKTDKDEVMKTIEWT